ncbi:hypothetical protein D9611_008586 [Ephemerocybe angulata]|uniref:Sugar phosphate transporter domain-containing protein n=1 Tax=Ephemerocybe angulata TaxID=980116 RepID=A0A8H5EV65_9AGAR|nr:hypothetical protein D9611_008586 [Tulosesus angulatus]
MLPTEKVLLHLAEAPASEAGSYQTHRLASDQDHRSSSSSSSASSSAHSSPTPMVLRANAAASSSSSVSATAIPAGSKSPSPFKLSRPGPPAALLVPPNPYARSSSSSPLPSPTSTTQRAYHDLGLPSPISPSSSNDSIHTYADCGPSLLPCPPTSPSGRTARFRLKTLNSTRGPPAVYSNLRSATAWLSSRLAGARRNLLRSPSSYASSSASSYPYASSSSTSAASTAQKSNALSASAKMSPAVWVLLYFALNLSLTLYNKFVLIHFPFPYTLTALHALCGTVGTFVMLQLGFMSTPEGAEAETRYTDEKGRGLLGEDQGNGKVKPRSKGGAGLGLPTLSMKESLVVVMFSMLYTVNIVVSNASLKLVTVPFHQVVRGSTPLFTIALSALLFKKKSSRAKLLSIIPVIVGVGFATYGDYSCTLFGFLLTLFGTLLAALKTVVTNIFLRAPTPSPSKPLTTGPSTASSKHHHNHHHAPLSPNHRKVPSIFRYASPVSRNLSLSSFPALASAHAFLSSLPRLSLSPLQLLYLMSPLAFIQTTLLAHFTGELASVNRHLSVPHKDVHGHFKLGGSSGLGLGMPSGWLVMNGVMALALNVVSFYANKKIGPVGMSVAANVKQVLTVLCAVALFDLTVTGANGVGIGLTLFGGAWYAHLEVKEKVAARENLKASKRSG